MFDTAVETIDLENSARLLDELKDSLDGPALDPIETVVTTTQIPFYPEYDLLEIKSKDNYPASARYVVRKQSDFHVLDYTNTPIYRLNQIAPIKLLGVNVADYIRFFLRFVKSKHGFFYVVQSVDDIKWKDEPPTQARKAIGDMILPITLNNIGKGDDDGTFYCTFHSIFQNCLFKNDAIIDPKGFVTINNEELLIEDMPVYDDILGQ